MDQYIKIGYHANSTVVFENTGFELVKDTRNETYDVNGFPLQVYYKRSKFPQINITVGNVTKTLQEINSKWREDNLETTWGTAREDSFKLCISGEFWTNESAISFIQQCDRFIKEVFHL